MGAEDRSSGSQSVNRPAFIVLGISVPAVLFGAAYWYWDDLEQLFSSGTHQSQFNPRVLRGTYTLNEPPQVHASQFSGSGFSEPPAPFGFVNDAITDIRYYVSTSYADVNQILDHTPDYDTVARAGHMCPGSPLYTEYRIAYLDYMKSNAELTAYINNELAYMQSHDLTRTQIMERVSVIKSEIETRHADLLEKARALNRTATGVVGNFHPLERTNQYSQVCT